MIKGGMDTKGMIKEANSILHQKHGAGGRKTPMERRIFVPDACGGGLFFRKWDKVFSEWDGVRAWRKYLCMTKVMFSSTSDLPAGTQYQFSANGWQTFASGGKGTFSYDYDRSPNGRTATFSIRKKYSDYCTQEAKKTVTLRGYQAVNSFSAQYDPSGKVRLSWTLEAGTGERESGDQFVIERADNSSFNNAKEVGRVSVNIDQTAAFTYEDDLVSDFVQGDVFYRITRSKTLDTEGWGWNFGMTASVSGVVLEHQRVLSVKAELSENESGRDVAVLTWTHNGTDQRRCAEPHGEFHG